MGVYQYSGFREDGRSAQGIVDADTAKGARLKLRRTGIYPTAVVEQLGGAVGSAAESALDPGKRAFSPQDLAVLTRQLATLLIAGLPLAEALGALLRQDTRSRCQAVLADLREQIRRGRALSAAMEGYPLVFPPHYVYMVRAGEASGALDQVLNRLADFLDQRLAVKHKVINAMLYPVIMLAVAMSVLFLLLAYVVPTITAVFADLGQALPWPTMLLIGASDFLRAYGLVMLTGVGLAGLIVARVCRTDHGRLGVDQVLLRLPLFGDVVTKNAVARFARTLATMLSSGVPLLDSLNVAKHVMSNRVLEEAVESARARIREGDTIADPLHRSGVFPSLVPHLIAIGEKSGELESMLHRIAQIYEVEVDRTITRMTTLLEPTMILVMGVVVFFIVVAILLPIFEMSHMIG